MDKIDSRQDYAFVACKKAQGRIGKEHEKSCYDANDAKTQDNGRNGAFIGSLVFLGTDVLSHKGGGGHGHGLDGEHDELVNLVVAAPSGHGGGTKKVDIGLDKNVGKEVMTL